MSTMANSVNGLKLAQIRSIGRSYGSLPYKATNHALGFSPMRLNHPASLRFSEPALHHDALMLAESRRRMLAAAMQSAEMHRLFHRHNGAELGVLNLREDRALGDLRPREDRRGLLDLRGRNPGLHEDLDRLDNRQRREPGLDQRPQRRFIRGPQRIARIGGMLGELRLSHALREAQELRSRQHANHDVAVFG